MEKMNYETFKGLVNLTKKLYKAHLERDDKLEKALGGDTTVITDAPDVEGIIEVLENVYGEGITLFFWEDWFSWSKNNKFWLGDVEYKSTTKNVWKYLEGKL